MYLKFSNTPRHQNLSEFVRRHKKRSLRIKKNVEPKNVVYEDNEANIFTYDLNFYSAKTADSNSRVYFAST